MTSLQVPCNCSLSSHLTCVFSTCPGDLHRDPDRASSSAAAAHGGSSDVSPAGPGPRGAHPLPSPWLQDPQQSAATTGVPSGPALGPPGSGPLKLHRQPLKLSKGEERRQGGQTGEEDL